MKLVEVIPGLATSKETLEATLQLAEKMGKKLLLSSNEKLSTAMN
jgi:3-hydroxyacyl-CoA dehydrogenase